MFGSLLLYAPGRVVHTDGDFAEHRRASRRWNTGPGKSCNRRRYRVEPNLLQSFRKLLQKRNISFMPVFGTCLNVAWAKVPPGSSFAICKTSFCFPMDKAPVLLSIVDLADNMASKKANTSMGGARHAALMIAALFSLDVSCPTKTDAYTGS